MQQLGGETESSASGFLVVSCYGVEIARLYYYRLEVARLYYCGVEVARFNYFGLEVAKFN